MSDEQNSITVPLRPKESIKVTVKISSLENIKDSIEDLYSKIDEINENISENMPDSFVVMDIDYVDGTSEQLKVATYENK